MATDIIRIICQLDTVDHIQDMRNTSPSTTPSHHKPKATSSSFSKIMSERSGSVLGDLSIDDARAPEGVAKATTILATKTCTKANVETTLTTGLRGEKERRRVKRTHSNGCCLLV